MQYQQVDQSTPTTETKGDDIVTLINFLCDTDYLSYVPSLKVLNVNIALEEVIAWILEADGRWQWDDSNHSNLPIGTYTLVNSQGTYSFNDKFLEIEEVQVMNVNGDYEIIQPIDQKEYSKYAPLEQDFETDGMPEYYDKVAEDTIKLYPAPDNGVSVTLASGLKIKFRRTADLFTTADTTQQPGFASPFHQILAYMAAIPYCMKYKKDRVALYENKVQQIKQQLLNHYARREQDTVKVMKMRRRAFK